MAERILVILEVSQKQDYIFARKELKENAARSNVIRYVTGSEFFRSAAGALYQEQDNLVYAGGGHTVLQFPNAEQARAFTRAVTEAAMRRFHGLEVFAKQMTYDETKTPGENLKALSSQLEQKKSRRKHSFYWSSFGVETLDSHTLRPVPREQSPEAERVGQDTLRPENGCTFPDRFDELAEGDNFIAVIHVDGNGMGKRVDSIYGQNDEWETCRKKLRIFSDGIQQDFEAAFKDMMYETMDCLGITSGSLPLRPVILAGDDVCFVTRGSIGLECARIFMERLSSRTNVGDQMSYASCAGVAIVHQKYPFHMAYNLAEELCSNAKRFGAELDPEGRVSAMDWHIQFGQLRDSLSDLRREYLTDDKYVDTAAKDTDEEKRNNHLELRPVSVILPDSARNIDNPRTYRFFQGMVRALQSEQGRTARGKLKNLRSAFQQGEVESQYFLHDKKISDLLELIFSAKYQTIDEAWKQYQKMYYDGQTRNQESFVQCPPERFKRCLYFDALELSDHWEPVSREERT